MNFCGAEYDADLIDYDDFDENNIVTAVDVETSGRKNQGLSIFCSKDEDSYVFFTDEDEEDEESDPAQPALDFIAEGPDDDERHNGNEETPMANPIVVVGSTSPVRFPSTPTGRRSKTSSATTPSPISLNPMADEDWVKETVQPNRQCPSFEHASTIDRLLVRLENGFYVDLFASGASKSAQRVILFVDRQNNSICLQGDSKKKGRGDFWMDMPIEKILRLEIGGKERQGSHPMTSFTLVVNQKGDIVYHDFEAETPVERELIVSTLMVILDQYASYSAEKTPFPPVIENVEDYDFGGTMDAPIPCSPSLEERELMLDQESEFSPRRSTKIFNDEKVEGTEASLVIHLEHLASPQDSFSMPAIAEDYDDYDDDEDDTATEEEEERDPASPGRDEPQTERQSTPRRKKFHPSNPISREEYASMAESLLASQSMISQSAASVAASGIHIYPGALSPPLSPVNMNSGGHRVLSPHSYQQMSGKVRMEDQIVEFAPSGNCASNWCESDVCTLALKDIADTCSGIFALQQAEDRFTCHLPSVLSEQQQTIEEYIQHALGAPSAFYVYLTEGEKWAAEIVESDAPSVLVNGRIRNRASLLNAQAARLRKLRSEMTFAAALRESQEQMHHVQTIQSFDDNRVRRNQELRVVKDALEAFHSSALLKQVVGTMHTQRDEPVEEDVAYYDSDPEDARPRLLLRKGPRQVAAELKNKDNGKSPAKRQQSFSGIGFEKIKSNKRVSKKLDEESIVQIVQTMTNERMTLIWHPTPEDKETSRSPLCVKVWIESGVGLVDGTFVLPKLCWAKVVDQSSDSDDQKRRLIPIEPHKIDLLDICRVRATESIDRQTHPFAEANKSFCVETQERSVMFEALSTEERDRIVYGLKLSIARLASLLMLRDVRAAEEFFGAVGPAVPGEAPSWAQGNKKKSGETLPVDICRVRATESIDRQTHPFAEANKSFCVETQERSVMFEALSTEERDRIVYGLKLSIARLASLLMLRDVRAAEEFFGAVGPAVPGEAPSWAQGNKKKSGETLPVVGGV